MVTDQIGVTRNQNNVNYFFYIKQGCQTPEEDPEPVVNKEGLRLRVKKSENNVNATSSEHLENLVSRMNIGTGPPGIPRFEHSEEDSVKVNEQFL